MMSSVISCFTCCDITQVLNVSCFLPAGTSSCGLKYRGTVDVSNLSDENDLDDLDVGSDTDLLIIDWFVNRRLTGLFLPLQISVSLCKDQPNTPLLNLMRRTGVPEVRRVLGNYINQLKSGLLPTVPNLDRPGLTNTYTKIV